jgi:hypothetical protein
MKGTLKLAAFVLAAILVHGPVSAIERMWYVDYDSAVRAVEKAEYARAETILRELIDRVPFPKANAPTYGQWAVDYTPYYYLGLALAGQERFAEARRAFDVEMKFGVISRDRKKMARVRDTIDPNQPRPSTVSRVGAID